MPKLVPIPDYADLITLKEFKECVACGGFIPYDGSGYYATENSMDKETDVWSSKKPPTWATHVAWFNK